MKKTLMALALSMAVSASCFAAIEFKGAGRQTMSLGVTECIPGEDTDDLCIRVDDALYAAKRAGKNRVVLK